MGVVGSEAIEFDTVVVGSGPGGYEAAIRASQNGQKTAIVERYERLGGVCLNVGCIPSKALIQAGHAYQNSIKNYETFGVKNEKVTLDFEATQKWKDEQVVKRITDGVAFLMKKNKIEVFYGTAYFNDDHNLTVTDKDGNPQRLYFENLIVATGSTPIEIGGFPFGGRIIDSTGALNLKEVPEKFVVIGGGVVGSELGTAYANMGAQVTILEGTDSILGNFEKDMVKVVQRAMKKKGMKVITGAMAKGAEDDGKKVTVTYEKKGKEEKIEADYVLVCVGRRPNTSGNGLENLVELDERGLVKVDKQGRTSVKNIYAIGDIVPGAALAHKASYEGVVAAEAIAGKPSEVDYKVMPSVAYVDPEMATYGLTEDQAKEQGLDVHSFKFPMSANGRAVTLDETDGFLRLVATKDDNVLVGGQMVGPSASDVMGEVGLAIEAGMNADDICLTIHGHPTLNECIKDCAEGLLGTPLNI